MIKTDEKWMARCLELAQKGEQFVSPNPLVGAVIVKNGKCVSEGYHEKYGGAHAEVNAIESALRNGEDLHGSSIYVNLEPCYHKGLTPPCVDLIIKCGIKRVVVPMKDPNPLVAGKSIQKLRQNGIECTTGILEKQARKLNEKFFTYITTGRPFVALKAAQTEDGFIARENGRSRWITNIQSRKYVHTLRRQYDAVVVGANTAIHDNPSLTVRHVKGRNPIRILIDGKLQTPLNRKIFDKKSSTIVYTTQAFSREKKKKIKILESRGVIVQSLTSKNGIIKLRPILADLADHKIGSLLVEGGQQTYLAFLYEHCVNKIYLFTAKKKFKRGLKTFGDISIRLRASAFTKQRFGTDILEELYIQ